jgi:hypothetical protein
MRAENRRRCAKACENCKRRKERCDGTQPCGRCLARDVDSECLFTGRPLFPNLAPASRFHLSEDMADTSDAELAVERLMNLDRNSPQGTSRSYAQQNSPRSSAAPVPHLSRLIRDAKGKFMFIGDSANLSFLQTIRRLIGESMGTCTLVADPLRYSMVEDTPDGHPNWIDAHSRGVVPKPSLAEATDLIHQYILATNCILDLFDESYLLQHLAQWLESTSEALDSVSSMYYLVLAIGAQTSPEEKDDIAESYFNYGRYLTTSNFMEDPSIWTVQSYALITMFMLGASRRNAAFMNLGIAVRAGYALGLHRREISDLFNSRECRTRERVWKVIRILDLFMSASLGRPPSTSETRDTTAADNYSASASLCTIFETILNEVYGKRMVSTELVERISERHRKWTARLHEGLGVDGIQPTDDLEFGQQPNIGLYHVKEAYYWTIVLLTRPFLVERVSCHIRMMATSNDGNTPETFNESSSNQALVHACVDSAVRTITLLRSLDAYEKIPKRLPFVVNSIFVSALVLGIAFFGDLDRSFPLEQSLRDAQALLRRFDSHDALAKRNLMIVEYLETACRTYVDKRDRQKMDSHSRLVGSIFGEVHSQESAGTHRRSVSLPQDIVSDSLSSDRSTLGSDHLGSRYAQNEQSNQAHLRMNDQPEAIDVSPSWNAGRREDAGFPGNNNHVLPRGLDAYYDPDLAFSPRTLWFDSYEETMPLFSMLHTGEFH